MEAVPQNRPFAHVEVEEADPALEGLPVGHEPLALEGGHDGAQARTLFRRRALPQGLRARPLGRARLAPGALPPVDEGAGRAHPAVDFGHQGLGVSRALLPRRRWGLGRWSLRGLCLRLGRCLGLAWRRGLRYRLLLGLAWLRFGRLLRPLLLLLRGRAFLRRLLLGDAAVCFGLLLAGVDRLCCAAGRLGGRNGDLRRLLCLRCPFLLRLFCVREWLRSVGYFFRFLLGWKL